MNRIGVIHRDFEKKIRFHEKQSRGKEGEKDNMHTPENIKKGGKVNKAVFIHLMSIFGEKKQAKP